MNTTEEWFDLVTESGDCIGKAPRALCHGHPGLMHRAVHVLVFSRDGRLFLQKRSPRKDVQPGKWDTSVGGHPNLGESNESAARREMQEELGLRADHLLPAYAYTWRSDIETERITAFAVECDGPFTLQPEEIAEGRFWTFDEIRAALSGNTFTPQFKQEFPRLERWLTEDRPPRPFPPAHPARSN